MPQPLTYPGVYIEEVSSGVRTITGVATSIALFIGWAARGPVDRAVRITSFADYERRFGGLDQRTLLGYSVRQFFDNGGGDAYVLRLAASGLEDEDDDGLNADSASGSAEGLTVTASSPGEWANDVRVRVTRRVGVDAADPVGQRFKLEVIDHPTEDAVVEVFENLSMDPTDARFAEDVVNGRSLFITVEADGDPPDDAVVIELDGGADGVAWTADDADFRTTLLASFGIGTPTDRIDLFNLVCVPGLIDASTIQTLQGRCRERRAFLIVDAPEGETVENMMNDGLDGLTGADANYSALYYPWVRAPDPLKQGTPRAFPPCGFVAGVYARTDASRGVWKAPAGIDAGINGASALEVAMSDAENGQLNPQGINCLRALPVYGSVVWGARTLHGHNDRASEWKYVPVRRMALFLEESLYRGTQWVVFEPNDEPLWAQIRLNIGAFLQNLFRQGAFQGRTPREAYFVKCDRETTTQTDINMGIVNIHVGFAPLKPAEFVVIRVQQIAGDIPV
ncbi:phage tail sheath family protein [Luteimonas saliphila]|uniref:phage tail sheath family protein n=1 Tax=Luteimonas saliphila TaxID=2804919 RepID=UPI00192D9701|nr:phage tail sheath subtilisin-like domain-containing protein [Luteimonas saliphila]